ncbi:MAG: hypothetical protein ABIW76_07695 [Fibrobacteria bacterium]
MFILLTSSFPIFAALGIKTDGHLDIPVLRKAYMESEFEIVRASLEGFLKNHDKDASREEKIFTHMYLGVIFAADSNSEFKAESHFNALLRLSPHIEPVDMFVPPKIQNMFDRIKQDFLKQAEYREKFDAYGNPLVVPARDSLKRPAYPKQAEPAKHGDSVSDGEKQSWIWWTVGSAAVIAGGVGIYIATASDNEPPQKTISADGRIK